MKRNKPKGMKIIISTALLLLGLSGFGQVLFEKGYIIKNNERVNCYIKNSSGLLNPTIVEYRDSPEGTSTIADVKSVSEFGIDSLFVYQRFNVNIDRSSLNPQKLSKVRDPEFSNETLYLKKLVSGKADLYEYLDVNLIRFFFKTDDHPIEQLIYKKYFYINPDRNALESAKSGDAENNKFRQQLQSYVKSESNSQKDISKLRYDRQSLIDYFLAYNQKTHVNNTIDHTPNKKGRPVTLALRLQPGIGSGKISYKKEAFGYDKASESNLQVDPFFIIGAEFEITIPSRSNSWKIFFTPSYYSFKTSGTYIYDDLFFASLPEERTLSIDYSTVQITTGGRYAYYLNKKSRLFIDLTFTAGLAGKETVKAGDYVYQDDFAYGINLGLGAGFAYSRYSIEARYGKNNLGTQSFSADFRGFNILLGYNFL